MQRDVGKRIVAVTEEASYTGQLVEALPDHIRMSNELVPGAEVFIPLLQLVTVLEPVTETPGPVTPAAQAVSPFVCGWEYLGRRLFELRGQMVGFELAGIADQGRITCGRIIEVAWDYVLIEAGVAENVTYNAILPLHKIQSVQVGVCPEPGAPIPAQTLQRKKK
jgi:hypothetical protein